jgi:hypothetical protein
MEVVEEEVLVEDITSHQETEGIEEEVETKLIK